jgi:photosystem II stability/assembly factor-like uncharacterized protein/regulator of replication initiation timing
MCFAQSSVPEPLELAQDLEFRNLTPGMTGGRISKVVKDPSDPSTWYVGVSSGSVWKTENNGTTWENIFKNQGSYAIGTVEIDPSDPNVIWVGTGENNSQRAVGYGDGIYKSTDGGETWTNMGLETSNHIGKIEIDPRDTDVVYVASQGPLWSAGGERGLYKTTDGGETWERVLHVSEDTGISDVVMDYSNPEILYAASYQRRRHFGILVAGGSEGAIFKSVDGGENWKKLNRGLPTNVDVGRIGLAISPQKPEVLYAIIAAEGDNGGFFRSDDRGENWTKKSDHMVVDAQYYMELFPSPHEFDKVYAVDVRTHYTEDGGSTWTQMSEENKHVDNHDIVFDPDDPNYIMLSNDGGIYESWDSGATWKFINNLPITQFYRVGIDNSEPFYYVYGGTQDNSTLGAPNQTINEQGIINGDWFFTKGGDGFQTRVDPENPDILYSQSQYGDLARYDRQSGQQTDIQPRPAEGEPPLRWHWNSPLIISPHDNETLYFAAQKLFKSEDRGNSWTPVSNDLTRQLDRNQMEVMGRVWSPEAVFKNVFTSPLSTIVALDESPINEGLIYAGTDEGLIQVTEDGGQNWRQVDNVPGVPEHAFVADLFASPINGDQVFAVFNNHKYGDYKPYVLVSNDRGRSWNTLSGDLPQDQPGWVIYQDHEDENILFVGTEFGLHISLDGGQNWTEAGDIPTISIRDIEIHEEEDDLVLASFGLGFFIADDYAYLRDLNQNNLSAEAHIFPVKEALQYIEADRHSGSQGHNFYSSPNPPNGAVIRYHLKESIPTLKQQRKREEEEKISQDEPIDYPDWERLEKEDQQEVPFVALTITDSNGNIVNRIKQPARSGLHSVTWNLRANAVGSSSGWGSTQPLVPPGEYQVAMSKVVDGEWTPIGNTQDITVTPLDNVTLPAQDREQLADFHHRAIELSGRIDAANDKLEEALEEISDLKEALVAHGEMQQQYAEVDSLRLQLLELDEELNGDVTKTSRSEQAAPSIDDRASVATASIGGSTSAATEIQQENYRIAQRQFGEFRSNLETVLSNLETLKSQLAEQGIIIE